MNASLHQDDGSPSRETDSDFLSSTSGDAGVVAESTAQAGEPGREANLRVSVFYLTRVGFRLPVRVSSLDCASVEEHPAIRRNNNLRPPPHWALPSKRIFFLPTFPFVATNFPALEAFHFRRSFAQDLPYDKRAWHRRQAWLLHTRRTEKLPPAGIARRRTSGQARPLSGHPLNSANFAALIGKPSKVPQPKPPYD